MKNTYSESRMIYNGETDELMKEKYEGVLKVGKEYLVRSFVKEAEIGFYVIDIKTGIIEVEIDRLDRFSYFSLVE